MTEKYTDEMLDFRFSNLQEQMESRFDQILDIVGRIETKADTTVIQTTKTNGHVAQAQRDIAGLQKEVSQNQKDTQKLKEQRTGLSYVYILMIITIIPIVGATLLKVWGTPQITPSQIKQYSQQGVDQAFQDYELKK